MYYHFDAVHYPQRLMPIPDLWYKERVRELFGARKFVANGRCCAPSRQWQRFLNYEWHDCDCRYRRNWEYIIGRQSVFRARDKMIVIVLVPGPGSDGLMGWLQSFNWGVLDATELHWQLQTPSRVRPSPAHARIRLISLSPQSTWRSKADTLELWSRLLERGTDIYAMNN
jgi:hypothetical protein